MLLDVGDLLAALNGMSNAGARETSTRASATARKKDPIVTIGYVLPSLVTSTAVLLNQGTLVRRVPGINVCARCSST
jgi:hypothetical protein